MKARAALIIALGQSSCAAVPPQSAETGASLYETHCASCHLSGGGVPGLAPSLRASPIVASDPAGLAAFVLEGSGEGAASSEGIYGNAMPGYAFLSDAALAKLLTHVRANISDIQAPVVTAEDVLNARP